MIIENKDRGRIMETNNVETPYYVIDVEKIDNTLSDLKNSLHEFWPQGIIGYSFKTNNLPWILSHMKEKGLYAEVVSSDEYQLAKEIGFSTNEIIFNGPAKRKNEFIDAIENKAIVNIDSKRELNWLLNCDMSKLKQSKIGLRVNFCLEDYCPGESQCGKEDGRFGFSYEKNELKAAIDFFIENEIPLSGIHLHCSSKTRSINVYKAISKVAVKIIREYNLKLEYLDIGGGYFGGVKGKPSFFDYFHKVFHILKEEKLLKKTNIIIEPGMALIGANMSYCTSVIELKETKNNSFAVLDGSRIHVDPLMKKKSYNYKIINKNIFNKKKKNQILCGFTCMENDRFFELNEGVDTNDLIIFEKVGAYTIGMAAQFIEFHPDIYVKQNNKLELIQRRRTVADFIIASKMM